jgi:hypothetical protein
VLEVPGPAAQVEGWEELLKSDVLFALKKLLATLRLLEAEIVFEAPADSVVQRELQRFIADGLSGHTAVKGIRCRTWILCRTGTLSMDARTREEH